MWCCYLVSGCGGGWIYLGLGFGVFSRLFLVVLELCGWVLMLAVLDACLVVMLGGVVGLGSPGLLCCLWVGVI